jgi:hypothetical protein
MSQLSHGRGPISANKGLSTIAAIMKRADHSPVGCSISIAITSPKTDGRIITAAGNHKSTQNVGFLLRMFRNMHRR